MAKVKYAVIKRIINKNDPRKKNNQIILKKPDVIATTPKEKSCLFFQYNHKLGPPYQILLDTNFINFSIQNKLDIFENATQCLLSNVDIYITDCVIGELEKMGVRYRLAQKLANDPRIKKLTCLHKGTYADDCIVERIQNHRCYVVATNDKDLTRRIRKIAGVPILHIYKRQYRVECLPEVLNTCPKVG